MPLAALPRVHRHSHRARQDWLALRYQQHPGSRDAVVAELLPIVHSIARKFKRGEEPLEDLVQVGSVGLLKALQKFQPDRGRNFVAYAVPTISGEIRRHYRDFGWAVHVPRSVQELAQKVGRAERELSSRTGRAPTVGAIAAALGEDEEDVLQAWLAVRGMRAKSLEAPSLQADDGKRPDERHLRFDDEAFGAAEARATLAVLTSAVPERERHILALRYQRGLSQREIGEEIGVSQMQVSRILRKALADMHSLAEAS